MGVGEPLTIKRAGRELGLPRPEQPPYQRKAFGWTQLMTSRREPRNRVQL